MATVTNISNVEDIDHGWKTYYLRVEVGGNVFFKIGVCKGAVSKRYAKEPKDTHLQILKIWGHLSEAAAYAYEERLFKEFPGDRPYIGRCGPFTKGGNTETYSHNVLEGEPPPHRYVVRMCSLEHMDLHTYGYSARNPKQLYAHLSGEVKYMDYSFGPEGSYLQVPLLSSQDAVVLATWDYLQDHIDGFSATKHSANWAQNALLTGVAVNAWSDYSKMRFEGGGFHVGPYDVWV
jgi:hypothetical protein